MLCVHLYLFVAYILFAPVISTNTHRCVNNFPDNKVLLKLIETETISVDFTSPEGVVICFAIDAFRPHEGSDIEAESQSASNLTLILVLGLRPAWMNEFKDLVRKDGPQ